MVIKTANGRKTQMWYFDQRTLTIKSRAINRSWDIVNAGKTNNMQVWHTSSQWFQIFMYTGENFVNIQNKKVLDISGNKDAEGQKVIVWKRHNGWNQRWRIVYTDKAKGPRGKGYNNRFGFHISRPFYFRSRMPMRRVVECVSNAYVRHKRWYKGRKAQQWIFDERSKTVQSFYWRNRAVEITSNGGSSTLRMNTVTSRWW
jgi:hypothetical protein